MAQLEAKAEWITRSDAAKRLGVTPMMVTKYVQRGMPTRDDKRVPWPEAQEWHRANVVSSRSGSWQFRLRQRQQQEEQLQQQGAVQQGHPGKAVSRIGRAAGLPGATRVPLAGSTNGHADGVVAESLAAALLRKERALADLRELEYKQKSGELASVTMLNTWFSAVIIKARDMFLRIGPENADRLAGETEPVKCAAIVTDAVRAVLLVLKTMDTPIG